MGFGEWLYRYRVAVYRETITKDSNGVVTGSSWDLATTGVACYKEPLPSTLVASLAGRIEGDNLFSMDLWHFDEAEDVLPGDFLRVLAMEDGTESAEFGMFAVVRGRPRAYASAGLLQMGRRVYMTSMQEVGPPGVS